ncbi:hypothetical protein SH2C18_00020 [Clostridium sediminicola]|uniref:hypothetical protein n=1 Tax=Clostridium sediminicola TaxID=3114879 RepID=UPI0031F260DC
MATGKYEMIVDHNKKVFIAFAEGFFSMEQGERFCKEFIQKSNALPANEYNLIVDAGGVKPSTKEVAEALNNAIKLYIEGPFKKRFVVKLSDFIGQSQFVRLGKTRPGFDKLTFVSSKDEAYTLL